jgi:hypothetical protein
VALGTALLAAALSTSTAEAQRNRDPRHGHNVLILTCEDYPYSVIVNGQEYPTADFGAVAIRSVSISLHPDVDNSLTPNGEVPQEFVDLLRVGRDCLGAVAALTSPGALLGGLAEVPGFVLVHQDVFADRLREINSYDPPWRITVDGRELLESESDEVRRSCPPGPYCGEQGFKTFLVDQKVHVFHLIQTLDLG